MKIRSLALSLATFAVVAAFSFAPAPAVAQHHSCGGSVGEGCWTPRQQQQQQRQWGLPEWRPQQHYGAPVLEPSAGHQRRRNRAAKASQWEWERFRAVSTRTRTWDVVEKTGVGRSIPPSDSRCKTLPGGYRLCPNQ